MKYLFGDSTPFPLAENFLDTTCAASEVAVALLRADEVRREERRLMQAAEERALHELEHLEVFDRRVEETFSGAFDALRTDTGQAARDMVADLRAGVLRWREAKVKKALETAALAGILPALGKFFARHQLPNTEWSLAWKAPLNGKSGAIAQVHARAPFGLYATFDVAIPPTHAWAKPARVATMIPKLSIRMMKKPVLRKARIDAESLDAYFITEVIDLPGESSLTLRRSSRKPSAGLRILLPNEAGQATRVARIDEKGARVSEPETMSPEDSGTLRRLFAHVGGAMRSLVAHRAKIRMAYLAEVPVGDMEQPAELARLFVQSVAPYVREIARRSNGRSELALKRTLGDGRREELFVSYAQVLTGVDALEPAHRAFFNAFDLARYPVAQAPRSLEAHHENRAAPMGVLVPARLPPPRSPHRVRPPMPSDAEPTQERPIMHLASA